MALDSRISLQKLEVFCRVVELGSVSRAAETLFVAQPVVSAHVKSLEERVGAKLLRRRSNRMVPTEAGEAVYAWARDVLTRSREMEREVLGLAHGARGAAVIASSMTAGSYMLPDILADFRRAREGAEITLMTSDPEHAGAATRAGECDFGVVIAEEDQGDLRELAHERLAEEDIVLVAAGGRFPPGAELDVDDLTELPFVASPADSARQRLIDRRLLELGLAAPRVAIQLGHAESMKRAVRGGLGVAFMFRSSVGEEIAGGELQEIPLRGVALTAPVLLLRRPDKSFTPLQRELMDAIRAGLGA
jgi:DNA-binding transcriptional LysR family regulator